MGSNDLSDEEKTIVFLRRMFVNFDDIPKSDYKAAYEAALSFIEYGVKSKNKQSPQLMDWCKDEPLFFAAINKVAGCETRSAPFMHWWTFLGFFSVVDNDGIWSFILSIRQKKAMHKKLEKHESEFFNANRELCEVGTYIPPKDQAQDFALQLQKELLSQKD